MQRIETFTINTKRKHIDKGKNSPLQKAVMSVGSCVVRFICTFVVFGKKKETNNVRIFFCFIR